MNTRSADDRRSLFAAILIVTLLVATGLTVLYAMNHSSEQPSAADSSVSDGALADGHGKIGQCTWEIRGDCLYIEGNGWMWDNSWSSPHESSWNYVKHVFIGDGVTRIGEENFKDCAQLESVVIGNGVTEISPSAFCGCINLTDVLIGNSVERISYKAFYDCGIRSLVIPDSVNILGSRAFGNCPLNSLTLPVSVNGFDCYTGMGSFDGCTHIEEITFTAGNGKITNYSTDPYSDLYYKVSPWYMNAGWLRSVTFADGVDAVGENMFRDYDGVLSLPHLRYIGAYAFANCGALTEVTVSDCENFGIHSFENCPNLVTVELDVPVVSDYVFLGCTALSNIIFDGSVNYIGVGSFMGCTALRELTIPDGVYLSASSFNGCTSLYSLTVPISTNTVVCKEHPAFEGCTRISEVHFTVGDGTGVSYYSAYSDWFCELTPWYFSRAAIWDVTFEEGIRQIGSNTFFMQEFYSITLPDSLQVISANAFDCCHSLRTLVIPENVIVIGMNAFYGCSSLRGVHFPASLSSIGDGAFMNCGYLSALDLPGICNIGDFAFKNCNITSVHFGPNIYYIGPNAFEGKFYEADGTTWINFDKALGNHTFEYRDGKFVMSDNLLSEPPVAEMAIFAETVRTDVSPRVPVFA